MERPQQRQHQQHQAARHCRPSGKECSMCGDVGFQKELFRCSSCRQRYQHRYCSSLYPKLPPDSSQMMCDWCVSKQPRRDRDGHQQEQAVDGFKAPGSVTATRSSVQSPLDCLLQAAENLEKFSVKKQARKEGSPCSEANVVIPPGREIKPKPLVHKRKRCSDLDMSKQDHHQEQQELLKSHHHHKLKSPTCNAATPGHSKPPMSPGYSHGFQFSPSKAGVGRRYRLLSEAFLGYSKSTRQIAALG
ncbi:hypothetical protein SELMODRAFT_437625 [Selaginella moellendorffii]|uniref:PHD-type zinc finger plants domain-containing protein n=1 Tax=Selaginella moellendorffii TaxID=88036 RepID=D8QNG9_SELML|nr:hypothetical protein SELMODRAFT_437625 [Selaginella moellendorffii]